MCSSQIADLPNTLREELAVDPIVSRVRHALRRRWLVADEAKHVGLDIDQLSRELAGSLNAPGAENSTVSASQLRELISTTFFASLEREEGRFAAPAVALVTEAMISAHGANGKDWAPIPFKTPKSFDVPTLVKLAPAIDHRQSLIAVAEREGKLAVVGIVRTNTMLRRFARGELSWASSVGYAPVVVTATDVGTIKIDVGQDRFAVISKGVVLSEGVDIFAGGLVFSVLERYSEASGLDLEFYLRLLKRILHELAERGHGGIVLVLPDNDLTFLREVYDLSQRSSSLQDAIRFASGERLGPTIETSEYVVGRPEPDPATVELARERRRAIEEHLFEVDVAGFGADLASIDGALALSPELSILAFGAHIVCNDPLDVPVQLTLDSNGRCVSEPGPSPLSRLGTRHNSAARFCYNRPGALALVVSQDGVISCLTRLTQAEERLTLWRPVALERHWHWRGSTGTG